MANYAKVVNNVVTKVIVADADFINSLVENEPGIWVETNSASIGYNYDEPNFYPPQPFNSWTLNTDTYTWEAPLDYPTDGEVYGWNESAYQDDNTTGWELVE
tara:strand:+ start:200 stop:505 length:306 start_codon:yes stop_codon:yes gene_type:complete